MVNSIVSYFVYNFVSTDTAMKKSMIIDIISGAFILLFVYAAISKLMDVDKFAAQIGQSPPLANFNDLISWSIPSLEILIAILLATPKWRQLGLYMAFGLMALFTAYIIAILQFSHHVPCSCGGVLERLTWREHLAFNIFFVALGFIGTWLQVKQTSTSNA